MSTIPQILKDCRTSMDKAIDSAKREFQSIRSGKASPNMLDTVRVEMYGQQMALNQVATVSAPEPRILMVTPFDKSQIKLVEKAIRESDLGLEPSAQGTTIRVPLPSMNEQRRKELVKVVHKKVDDAKVAVRNCRRDGHETLRDQEKKKEISADDLKRGTDRLQKLTDKYVDEVEKVGAAKEREIMEI